MPALRYNLAKLTNSYTQNFGFLNNYYIPPKLPERIPTENLSPCLPSPCGSNAICKERNGVGSCQCLPDYFGDPYEGCRPECVLSSDCSSNTACIQSKCQDPCPGVCGTNGDCQVVNHLPSCTCKIGYTGDPYRYCNIPPIPRKKTISPNNNNNT